VNKSDWKIFGVRVPEWRERYLRRKNQELVELLGDEALTPTVRFWRAKDRMGEEVWVLTTCLDGHSKEKSASCIGDRRRFDVVPKPAVYGTLLPMR